MATSRRLTDRLSLVLSKASSAVVIGKDHPEHAQKACKTANDALTEAFEILNEIRRAAGRI